GGGGGHAKRKRPRVGRRYREERIFIRYGVVESPDDILRNVAERCFPDGCLGNAIVEFVRTRRKQLVRRYHKVCARAVLPSCASRRLFPGLGDGTVHRN